LTEVIASNLRPADPHRMKKMVGSNVDASHDLQIKHITDEEIIGILILPKSGPAVTPAIRRVPKTADEVAS
jgi:hypothetical protein